MAEYALSTNLFTFAQAGEGFFAWPDQTGEAEVIKALGPGDTLIPKFAQAPAWDPSEEGLESLRQYCKAVDVDFNEALKDYQQTVGGGSAAVPFLLKVTGSASEDTRYSNGTPWMSVPVEKVVLEHPLSTSEFLRFRQLPIEIAAQFKGTVAPGRHLQELPAGIVGALVEASKTADREKYLRQYTVVEAATSEAAREVLDSSGRSLTAGDRVFVAAPGGLLGVHDVTSGGELIAVGPPIPRAPDDLLELFGEARLRARPEDQFAPGRAIVALRQLKELVDGPTSVVVVDDFAQFHDRYNLLASKVTQALEIAKRPLKVVPPAVAVPEEEEEEGAEAVEIDELAALAGLTTDALRKELPPGMAIADEVLADAVTALRAGNHLLLSGPPGTGKTTLAEALCRAVMGNQYEVATASADWTTFDTIGGYMPAEEGLEFEPGIVLRCLQTGRWLVIDEVNRADIDKAFGPLFTLLSGAQQGGATRRVVLPFQRGGRNIEVRWAEKRTGSNGAFVLTPGWRLVGTMNVLDKASLFQLSFAFLRRFAIIDVPLPERAEYEAFFRALCADVPEEERDQIVQAAMELAFGPRQLGPAIFRDIATFMAKGLAETASGKATFSDAIASFVSAIRLYAVPQYEGARAADAEQVVGIVRGVWPDKPNPYWQPLKEALEAVTLA